MVAGLRVNVRAVDRFPATGTDGLGEFAAFAI